MLSASKFKQSLGSNKTIPAVYSFLTKPFSTSLRHLEPPIDIPANPKKVTVVVPNYNYKTFLDARIKSILNQTYPLYELIILDDASTDGSSDFIERELLPKIRTKNPDLKLKFIKNPKNSGQSIAQWQKGFEEATGDFLWLAEADDLSDPNFLATTMQKFNDKKVALSYTNSVAINETEKVLTYDFQNRSVDKQKSGHWQTDFIENGESEIKNFFAINCNIPNVSACVFRLDPEIPYVKYLDSAKAFAQCGDWYLYLQVLRHGKIAYSRPALNFFRIHQNSVTASSKKSEKLLEEVKTLHTSIAKDYALSPNIISAQKSEEQRILNRQ